jgi:hypothetical protein
MEYVDRPSCVWRVVVFLTAVIAIPERGEERRKLNLVVAGDIGGGLRLELAGGNLAHRNSTSAMVEEASQRRWCCVGGSWTAAVRTLADIYSGVLGCPSWALGCSREAAALPRIRMDVESSSFRKRKK